MCPPKLDTQLSDAMHDMARSTLHVQVDRANGILKLSSIFDWFSSDFISVAKGNGALTDYVQRFLPVETRQYLQQHPDIPVHFLPYDWSLNEQ